MDEVAIRVIGGGPNEWVLVPAQMVDLNMYRLLDFVPPPGCLLELGPGDLVTTIPLPDEKGIEVLVAHSLYFK
jgi:hypothetical protein